MGKGRGLRVIAGDFRGRRLKAPRGLETRPTIDRVREALFAVLNDVKDCRVLDIYARTGALGIEAMSRGAASATFVETRREAQDVLRDNLLTLGIDSESTLLAVPIERAGKALRPLGPFDLVVADPPWPIAAGVPAVLGRVLPPVLSAGARLIIGHRAGHPLQFPSVWPFRSTDERTWGDAGMSFFGFEGAARDPLNKSE